MDTKYIYIENDNSYFRMRAGTGLYCIDEIWTPDGWKLYTGDRGKPYLEGMQIAEADLPPFRKPVATKPAEPVKSKDGIPSGFTDRTGKGRRAFQILGAPAKSKLEK